MINVSHSRQEICKNEVVVARPLDVFGYFNGESIEKIQYCRHEAGD